MAAQHWYSADYFSTDYWSADYLATSGESAGLLSATLDLVAPTSGYWSSEYWSQNYWSSNWWGSQKGADFRGTFVESSGFTGFVETTLDGFTAEFTAATIQTENFDVTVSIGVSWTITEHAVYTGEIAPTLDDATSLLTGTFVAAGGAVGTISVTLEDSASAFEGTFEAPPNVTGTISRTLDNLAANFDGVFVEAGVFLGSISGSTDVSAAFSGTYDPGTFTGSIGATLEDASADFDADFFGAGTVFGPIRATLADHTSTFSGTFFLEGGNIDSISLRGKHRVSVALTSISEDEVELEGQV